MECRSCRSSNAARCVFRKRQAEKGLMNTQRVQVKQESGWVLTYVWFVGVVLPHGNNTKKTFIFLAVQTREQIDLNDQGNNFFSKRCDCCAPQLEFKGSEMLLRVNSVSYKCPFDFSLTVALYYRMQETNLQSRRLNETNLSKRSGCE